MNRLVLDGEIVGRRVWSLGPDETGLYLCAAIEADVWRPGTNEARCARGFRHDAPDHKCTCGLYAHYDRVPYLGIPGLITAWGQVELHPDGFRAQYARVAALVDLGMYPGELERLAGMYGVPIIAREQWLNDSFITEFGEIVPPEMRPAASPDLQFERPRLSRRREIGLRLIYGSVGIGALAAMWFSNAWPIMAATWFTVGITLLSLSFPDWFDR